MIGPCVSAFSRLRKRLLLACSIPFMQLCRHLLFLFSQPQGWRDRCVLLCVVYIKHPSAPVCSLLAVSYSCLFRQKLSHRCSPFLIAAEFIFYFFLWKKEMYRHWFVLTSDIMWRQTLSVALSAVIDSYLEILSPQTQWHGSCFFRGGH